MTIIRAAFSSLLFLTLNAVHAEETITIPVDSPAFVFSPGNWTGDAGRVGKKFRQTWYPGAYFRVDWETTSEKPTAKILLEPVSASPKLAYSIDGVWKSQISCDKEISIGEITGAGKHELTVYLTSSDQNGRWGKPGESGSTVVRVTGLEVDGDSTATPAAPVTKWALFIGDSITEGIGGDELCGYAHLIGLALQTQGYEYGISACGWSGWINKGDNPPGDVPGYYLITHSDNGIGGQYDEANSRWNKIDGNGHSLLDAKGHISGYGETGQEPSLILINFGTNDALWKPSTQSDLQASIIQALGALRAGAPDAQIVVIIPFGQYCAKELRTGVEIHKKNHPDDTKISIIDLGPSVARALAANGLMGSLHPNDRGHATFAALLIPQIVNIIQGHVP